MVQIAGHVSDDFLSRLELQLGIRNDQPSGRIRFDEVGVNSFVYYVQNGMIPTRIYDDITQALDFAARNLDDQILPLEAT